MPLYREDQRGHAFTQGGSKGPRLHTGRIKGATPSHREDQRGHTFAQGGLKGPHLHTGRIEGATPSHREDRRGHTFTQGGSKGPHFHTGRIEGHQLHMNRLILKNLKWNGILWVKRSCAIFVVHTIPDSHDLTSKGFRFYWVVVVVKCLHTETCLVLQIATLILECCHVTKPYMSAFKSTMCSWCVASCDQSPTCVSSTQQCSRYTTAW